eukprot:scaffold8422_cov82-Phaeocystis_antarctica.AAC.3
MTHHSLEQYVGPATTSSVWQPARKTGKQASDCWMLPWSMHALSCDARQGARVFTERARVQRCGASATSQSVGSMPVVSWHRFAQRDTTACLAPGASFSSLHEWLRKAVTSPIAAGSVRGEQPAGGQAPEELRGAFERGVGNATAAADERRDRRRLFLFGTAPAQAPQAAVDAATIAGRGKGGAQEEGNTHDRSCPSEAEEAVHHPQPPQGGAGLHGVITAAAQRGGERRGGGELQRSNRETKFIWPDSGECCSDVEHPEPRLQDEDSGAHDADRACIGGEEAEEEEAEAQRERHLPAYETTNGGLDRQARHVHDRRAQTNHK